MGDFRREGGKHSGGGFGQRDRGQSNFSGRSRGESFNRDRGLVTMHQAVCDQCGKSCEVPFRPSEGKPIYCNLCFGGKKNEGSERGSDRFSQEKNNSYKAPRRNDYSDNSSKGNNDELKNQLVLLNSKMDRLISAVENMKNNEPLNSEKKVITPVINKTDSKTKKIAEKMPVIKGEKSAKKNTKVMVKKVATIVSAVKVKKAVKKISKKVKR
ncbi:hypothetical protein K0B03_02140 [Patescibacteria group bacterium]|nr:hypothetical protein [Patescibacteria group bacterium]